MRMGFLVILLSFIMVPVCFASEVALPWEEFKQLYRERVEREIKATLAPPDTAPVYALEAADFRIKIEQERVWGEMQLTGTVISGSVRRIPIFNAPVVIQRVDLIEGGHLVVENTPAGHVFFRPSETRSFQIRLSFFMPVTERRNIRTAEMPIPAALKNILRIETTDKMELIEAPGIKDARGVFHFTTQPSLRIRFGDEQMITRHRRPVIDMLSQVTLKNRRFRMTSLLSASLGFPEEFSIVIPPGFDFVGISEDRAGVRVLPDGSLTVRPQNRNDNLLALTFARARATTEAQTTLFLPSIRENDGVQGHFTLISPDNVLLALAGQDEVSRVVAAGLSPFFRAVLEGSERVFKTGADQGVRVNTQFLEQVAAAPLVLDRIAFFSAFEENGSNLAVMVLELPPDAGGHLAVEPVAGADIWYLKVNGQLREIYTDPKRDWIIPLPDGQAAHVELAILRRGTKLNLSGRLDLRLPAVKYPCRELHIGIALPARVELVSLEGPVSPASAGELQAPPEFIGQPYHFQRAFYRGDGMDLALMYREPAQSAAAR